MKKLILLMFLGVVFFIGGQWMGLITAESMRNSLAMPPNSGSGASAHDKYKDAELGP